MKWISNFIFVNFIFFAPFHQASANVKAVEKNASKIILKQAPQPKLAHGLNGVIPYEYKVFEQAKKDSFLPKLTLPLIESHERELKNLEWNTINRSLEKEAEDLYWSYEIARGEKLTGNLALNVWIKALNSLNQFKWIYFWNKETSAALVKICKPHKKTSKNKAADTSKEEKCSYLAKKVNDAFPKLAMETQALKEILPDSSTVEFPADKYERLSQTYGEKTEKDEQAFAEVLDHYLNHQDSDLYKTGLSFIDAYPKSILRFRTIFLIAERQFANGDKKEAEKNYSLIINQIPYSYYAIVSSERLGISLKDRLIKEPLKISSDINSYKLNFLEKESLYRLQGLVKAKKAESVGIELEQFSRIRTYPTDFLIYLIQQANKVGQDLSGFRFATEILQRKNEVPLNSEFVEMIFPDRFVKEIAAQAKISQIDPLLVVSLMKQESGFKGGILSSSGAAGLMQLMPFTAIEVQKDLELRKLREPVKNIEVGTKYLASLLNEKFNGNVVYALAGYNAGPHRVVKWSKDAKSDWNMQEYIEAIPFKETRDYVMSILRNRYWYQYRRGIPQQSVFEAWRSP